MIHHSNQEWNESWREIIFLKQSQKTVCLMLEKPPLFIKIHPIFVIQIDSCKEWRVNPKNPKLCPVCQSGQIWKTPNIGWIQYERILRLKSQKEPILSFSKQPFFSISGPAMGRIPEKMPAKPQYEAQVGILTTLNFGFFWQSGGIMKDSGKE